MQPTVRAENIYQEVKQASPAASKKQIIKSARDRVVSNHEQECKSNLEALQVQGKFLQIMDLQKSDPFYRSIMYDLPHKQLSWLMRASIDCLPSFANLRP